MNECRIRTVNLSLFFAFLNCISLVGCTNQSRSSSGISALVPEIEGKWFWQQGVYYGHFVLEKEGDSYKGTLDDEYEGTYGDELMNVEIKGNDIKFTRYGEFGVQFWRGKLETSDGLLKIVDGRWEKESGAVGTFKAVKKDSKTEKEVEPTDQPPTQVVEVLANVPGVPFSTWQETGVTLIDGDVLYIKAKGVVNVSPTQEVTPDGTGHTITRSLIPKVSFVSLVGRTHYGLLDDGMDLGGRGTYGPGFVGSDFRMVFRNKAPSFLSPNRSLFLGVNDSMDDDNSHSFTARIWVVRNNKVLTLPSNDD